MLIYLQMLDSQEDRDKFTALYKRYRGLMFYCANKILNHAEDAEDAVQQAFMAVLKNFTKISEIECPKTKFFVVTIVERKSIDILRQRNRHAAERLGAASYSELIAPEDGLGLSPLAEAIAALPATLRQVITLRKLYGFSTKETAELMGTTRGAVYKAEQRAKARLRKILEEDESL